MNIPHGLGRIAAPDTRDRRFLMVAVQPQLPPPRPRKLAYHLGPTQDQGSTSMCVGYSIRHKLTAAPIMVPEGKVPEGSVIYRGAQENDEWPGEGYDGTSVRGGFKWAQQQGYIKSYVWATSAQDCHAWLHNGYGTIVVGTDWTEDMFTPDPHGFVQPSGPIAGGHAYHLFWSVEAVHELWFQNSWGDGWGVRIGGRGGCFRMRWADFDRLMLNNGEAGAGIEQKVKA